MARTKNNPNHPPTKWVDLLEEHDHRIGRVRVLWRRGGQEYRPLTYADASPDASEWLPGELPATHFEWETEADQSPVQRRSDIAGVVGEIWSTIVRWTREQGVWCDFKLVALADDGSTLFEDGKRCHPPEQAASSGPDAGPRTVDDSATEFSRAREYDRRLESKLSDLLDRTMAERDQGFAAARESIRTAQESVASAQQTLDNAPRLLNQAADVLKDMVDYQSKRTRELIAEKSGKSEMQAHAIKEMEITRRYAMAGEVATHAIDSLIANVVPLANTFFETFGGPSINVYPEFKRAQQAMAYLVITFTPTQLGMYFGARKDAASAFVGLLHHGSHTDDEREALEYIRLAIKVLRSEKFHDIAQAEQKLAARYIIGRLALYRMSEVGEEAETGS